MRRAGRKAAFDAPVTFDPAAPAASDHDGQTGHDDQTGQTDQTDQTDNRHI